MIFQNQVIPSSLKTISSDLIFFFKSIFFYFPNMMYKKEVILGQNIYKAIHTTREAEFEKNSKSPIESSAEVEPILLSYGDSHPVAIQHTLLPCMLHFPFSIFHFHQRFNTMFVIVPVLECYFTPSLLFIRSFLWCFVLNSRPISYDIFSSAFRHNS